MKQYLLTAALLVGAVVGAYGLGVRSVRPPDSEVVKLQHAVDQLNARVARNESAPPKQIVVQTEMAVAGLQGPPVAASNHARTDPRTEGLRSEPLSQVDVHAYYQTSFERQGLDARWSRQSSGVLRDLFGQLATQGTTLRSVDCRETMCRAEAKHDSEAESHAFISKWTNSEAFLAWKGAMSGGVTGGPRPDGSVTTVIFLAREGTELPTFD